MKSGAFNRKKRQHKFPKSPVIVVEKKSRKTDNERIRRSTIGETIIVKESVSDGGNVETVRISQTKTVSTGRRLTTTFNWNDYLAFGMMAMCVQAIPGVFQGLANKLLGKSSFVAAITMLCLYLPQFGMQLTSNIWAKKLSHNKRIIISNVLQTICLIIVGIIYTPAMKIKHDNLMCFERIVIMLCLSSFGISQIILNATLQQYSSFYDGSNTNAISTGDGIGALIGAGLAVLATQIPTLIVLFGIIVFPIGIVLIFNFMLSTSPAYMSWLSKQNKKHLMADDNSKNDKNISIESDISVNNSILSAMKAIFYKFAKFSIPLVLIYFVWEFMRNGFLPRIWKEKDYKTFYQIFNLLFRVGSFLGKFSTNYIHIKRFIILNIIEFAGLLVMIFLYALKTKTEFTKYLITKVGGQIIMYIFVGLPVGIVYGASSSNIYYELRNTIQDRKMREWCMGYIRYIPMYGQILGSGLSMMLKLGDKSR